MSNTDTVALNSGDNDDLSFTQPMKDTRKKSSKWGIVFLVTTLLVGASVGVYFAVSKNSSADENCILRIKDSHQPVLEITLSSSDPESDLSEIQAKELERSIVDIYNDESGGCSDEYKRWMYGINVIDQSVQKHAVLEEEAESSISHKFDDEYDLVIRFETMISCDDCVDDEAFASVYPEYFGSRASRRRLSKKKKNNGPKSSQAAIEGIAEAAETVTGYSVKQVNVETTTAQHQSYYDEAKAVSTRMEKYSHAKSIVTMNKPQ